MTRSRKRPSFHFRWIARMTDSIHRVYPKAKHQVCCVHVARNISSKVRVKDRAAILDDLRPSIKRKTVKKL